MGPMYGIQLGQGRPDEEGIFGCGIGGVGDVRKDSEGCLGIGAAAFDVRLGCIGVAFWG